MVSQNDRSTGGNEEHRSLCPVEMDLRAMQGPATRWLGSCPDRPWHACYASGVRPELSYPRQRLGWLLHHAAERFPDRVACYYYHERLTYGELLTRAQRLSTVFIREGLQPGDRVGLLLPNLPETLVTLFATWMAGGVVVCLSPLMVADEVQDLLQATDCRIVVTLDVLSPLVCQEGRSPAVVILTTLAGRLKHLEQIGYAWVRLRKLGFASVCPNSRVIDFDDSVRNAKTARDRTDMGGIHEAAFILPTGGTTGKPKAVTLSHSNLMAQACQLSHWSGAPNGTESILGVLPIFHSYGLSTLVMMGTMIGATLILHHHFRPAPAARLIEQYRPTILFAVPAMLSALNSSVLRHGSHDLRSLWAVISGGSALPASVAEEFREHTGGVVVEGYGLSEAGPVTHVGPLDGTAVPGTIGLPVSDTDARIVDSVTGTETLPAGAVGELLVRGPQVMLGYWNNPVLTAAVLRDGWLHTGDLASCDERGFFKIVDRIKDLIITSGFNVYPTDVEEVLRTYPGVRDVAVVGVPDELRGEVVKAILVLESPRQFHRRDFDAFVHRKLAAQKRPCLVEIRDRELPRSSLGKLLRRELREPALAHAAVTH